MASYQNAAQLSAYLKCKYRVCAARSIRGRVRGREIGREKERERKRESGREGRRGGMFLKIDIMIPY